LRQEFRELEILDELTKLRYEKKLSKGISGDWRNTIIREYQLWKGTAFVPKHVHAALRWSKDDPFHLLEVSEDVNWYIHKGTTSGNEVIHDSTQNKKGKFSHIAYVTAQWSKPLLHLSHDQGKNIGLEHPLSPVQVNTTPLGVQWNSATSSCAYDALITIMYSLWKENDNMEYNTYASHNRHWQLLHSSFKEVENGTITLERARD
ncbi:hypothetical protein K439DRAFT_1335537, partial [Ramaria rubella]